MKKFLLLIVTLVFWFSTFAQLKPAKISEKYKYLKATKPTSAIHETMNFSTASNPTVAPSYAKSINEHVIGITRYDLQTNSSVQNRIYLHADGTIGATFTYGLSETSFADKGTAYNYYDASTWGLEPSARIETSTCGWPSYAPLGTTGEIIVSHNDSTGLLVSKRDPKGTGAWTQSTLIGPACSNGTTALLWPRMITSGNTIHIIACTNQAVDAGDHWYYEGLCLALVYIRSTDGGATWDAPVILPGMDSASIVNNVCLGFSGDSYAWANSKGDTIAFVVGGNWQDVFVMKSYNGGDNWTKIPVFDFPDITTFPTPRIISNDGSLALALDVNGKAHVVFGRMAVSKNTASFDSSSYYPYTDGLVYWNESMPVLDTTQLSDLEGLSINGQLAAYMDDYSGNDTIDFPEVPTGTLPFGTYYLSLSSMPQIIIDEYGTVYISYSKCREDKIDITGTKLYRHFYIVGKDPYWVWFKSTDLTGGIAHDYDECIFGSMSYTKNNKIHMIYQADGTPGLAVKGDETSYGDNLIYYIYNNMSGIKENESAVSMNIYPNPSTVATYIDLNLVKSSNVSILVTNLVGQEVMNKAFGQLSTGNHKIVVDVNSLNSGIYFFTVQAGNERITKKIIVD